MTDTTPTQAQRNHDGYHERYRAELEEEHFGQIALMHDGEVVHIFNDESDAYTIGYERFGFENFSLKRIGEQPLNLGVMAGMMG